MPANAKHSLTRRRGVASAANNAAKVKRATVGLMPAKTLQWADQISTFHVAWQQEWMSFLSHRLSEDAAFIGKLVSCTAPEQVARSYADFVKQTIDDYQNELAKWAQLGTEMTVAAVPVAPNGHDVLAPNELEMLGKLNA
jgi:hypothetical protein